MAMLKKAQAASEGIPPQEEETNEAPASPVAPVPTEGEDTGMETEGAPAEGVEGEGTETASPEEQQEYERVLGATMTAMYKDPEISKAIVDQLQPEDKIGSVVKASVLLIKQIDEKVNMDEVVIPQITQDVVDQMIQLAERTKGMQFSEQEMQGALGATFEGVMQVFGINPEDAQSFMDSLDEDEITRGEQDYQKFLNGSDAKSPAAPEKVAPAAAQIPATEE